MQTLHVERIPMHCNQVPTGKPRFRVSHMRVPTFRGRELCQTLCDSGVLKV
jgi:hypothetical protein